MTATDLASNGVILPAVTFRKNSAPRVPNIFTNLQPAVSVNPATGDRIESYERDGDEDVESKLETATDTFREWRERPLRDREKLLASVADVLRTNKERYATVMTREVGKPVTQARAECVYVNQLTKSDPRVPFGGIGDSGYGRELAGPGIREFVNRKTVWTE